MMDNCAAATAFGGIGSCLPLHNSQLSRSLNHAVSPGNSSRDSTNSIAGPSHHREPGQQPSFVTGLHHQHAAFSPTINTGQHRILSDALPAPSLSVAS